MIADIYNIGCLNVVSVVTDTCSTMRKAWQIVEDEFPWISCLPCVPHVASLLMKDIGNIPVVAKVIKDKTLVVGWFSNHQKPLAILREKTKAALSKKVELIKAGATRFGSNTLVGERPLKLKPALQQTVVDQAYVKENYKDTCDSAEHTNGETRIRQNKGGTAKSLVLDDSDVDVGGFWARVEEHTFLS